MDARTIIKGMQVRVSDNLHYTEMRFSTTPKMRDLYGKVITIDDVNVSGKSAQYIGCVWDVRDFSPLEPIKKIKIKVETFDPKHLDVD